MSQFVFCKKCGKAISDHENYKNNGYCDWCTKKMMA